VGTGYFDEVQKVVGGGQVSTGALDGSTEQQQFEPHSALRALRNSKAQGMGSLGLEHNGDCHRADRENSLQPPTV